MKKLSIIALSLSFLGLTASLPVEALMPVSGGGTYSPRTIGKGNPFAVSLTLVPNNGQGVGFTRVTQFNDASGARIPADRIYNLTLAPKTVTLTPAQLAQAAVKHVAQQKAAH